MLKRISTAQLRTGMYLHEFCGSWMEHPFWRQKFLLKNPADLRRILDSGIREVWIDTAKGLDVPEGEAAIDETQAETEANAQLEAAAVQPLPSFEATPLARELVHAEKICARAREAVTSVFQEARMGRALEADTLLPLVAEITGSVARNPGALISLARLKHKDEYTYMHSVAVCALMASLSRQLGLDEEHTREAGLAGLLHDLGKALIPDEILNKPGKLSDSEFNTIKGHPLRGAELLQGSQGAGTIPFDVCLHHHEKMDGTGYPHRLAGEQISLFARMGAVCDVYDAITSDRPYKAGWSPAEAMHKMAGWCNGHFDEQIFRGFVKAMGIYPTGSLVRLASGRLGVVMEQNPSELLKPRIKAFFSLQKQQHISPEVVDLALPSNQDRIVAREDAEKWGFRGLDALWRIS